MSSLLQRRARLRRILSITAALSVSGALALGGAQAATASSAKSYPNAHPSWAKPANEHGRATSSETVEGEIGFSLRDQASAENIAQAVSTPGNPLYGKYLTPKQWIDRYSPTKSDFNATLRYLKSNGLTITGTPKSRLFITFRGPVDTLEGLFSTDLKQYSYRGHTVIAPATTPSIPARAAENVKGVYLGTARTLTRPSAVSAGAAPAAAGPVSLPGVPCSHYWLEHTATLPEAYGRTQFPTANCGYLGPQFRSAYGATSSLTGKGQTVAVIDAYASPTLVKDAKTFAGKHGLTPLTSATYHQIVPKKFYDTELCGGIGGWQGEQVLDVTAVHGVAPKARTSYVGGFNCGTGLDVAMSQVLDERLANIVSNSYGYIGEYAQSVVQVNENQHLQAAAEGIGLYFSSGDGGDESASLDTPSVDYPASSPYVTAVGGTTTEIAQNGSVALETAWGNHYDAVLKDPATGALSYQYPAPGPFQSGAGGGTSEVFARPWYQDGTVSSAGRGVPDVAADADPRTGELIGIREFDDATGKSGPYTEEIYGGTSLASPLFAAEVALVQQKTHRVYGFLNPLAYAASVAKAPVFRDVLSNDVAVAYNDQFSGLTSLVTGNLDTSLATAPGWDDVTGLGVLKLDAIGSRMR